MKLTEKVKVKKKRVIMTMIMKKKVVVVVVMTMMTTMMIMTMKVMRLPDSHLVCTDSDKVGEDYINEWT
jgi:hypothetical protein